MANYIVLHKPYGVICQFSPAESRATLAAFVPVGHVYPVGRLDADSEGLLLLTDDGPLAHRLTEPRYEHPKTYLVQVEGEPTDEAMEKLRAGVIIQGYWTQPAEVRRLAQEPELPPRDPPIRFRKSIPTSWLEIVLREGKNRQIRRMTAAVGFPTLRLVRVAIGPLRLGELAPGQWRHLRPDEVKALRKLSGQRKQSGQRR